ncbi:MAG TPA: trigger factor [Candidatus Magasanikbacteria bacterium]|nr:trigger factor [Candidatus Magasanikbacteria bacterium]
MSHTTKKLDQNQIEFIVTVTPAEYQKHLEKASVRISERTAVKGFRSGKVPYEIMKKEVGEMNILQEALEPIVQETFYQAVVAEKLETIGMPKIDLEKMAPGNDLVYKAVVALMPKVKLADIDKIKVEHKIKEIKDEDLNETLDAARGMNAVEVVKEGPAEGTDKLVLDFDMFLDKVPIDGGQAKNHQVYLSEQHYIPGFNEQVKGLKPGEEKEFALDFPADHYQKHLAGKKVGIKVKVKEVYARQLPELSDDLAKKLGQESVAKLKDLIRTNLEEEAKRRADQKFEIEMLDQMIAGTEFDPIPEVLIDAERQKMFYELKADLERHGVSIEQYLADIKKDEKTLFEEFKTQAEKRARAALISRQVAIENHIHVHDEEIDAEIKVMEAMYATNKEYLDKLKRPEVRDTIAISLQNRKVMEWLTAKVKGEEMKEHKCEHQD